MWEPGRFPLTLPPRVAFRDELWMTAQTLSYSSPDGLTWTEHAKTDWGERIYHAVVFFQGRLWMFGGLDYDTSIFSNDIWSSSDGVTWQKEGTAAWSPRGAQTMVVFRDRLWLFGGADHVGEDKGTDQYLNDVWVSDDGLEWIEVTGNAPWSPRAYPGVVELDDALYMIGGEGVADVWQTSDGSRAMACRGSNRPSTRHGRRAARSPSCSRTRCGSSAASTPVRTTTGAAISGR